MNIVSLKQPLEREWLFITSWNPNFFNDRKSSLFRGHASLIQHFICLLLVKRPEDNGDIFHITFLIPPQKMVVALGAVPYPARRKDANLPQAQDALRCASVESIHT